MSKIVQVSRDFGVSESLMTFVVDRESRFDNCAVGDRDQAKPSLGPVQISMLYHPEVSESEAFDPEFSLEFLASRVREGKCSQWTSCREYISRYPLAPLVRRPAADG